MGLKGLNNNIESYNRRKLIVKEIKYIELSLQKSHKEKRRIEYDKYR